MKKYSIVIALLSLSLALFGCSKNANLAKSESSTSSAIWETGQIADNNGNSVICYMKDSEGMKLCTFNYYVKNVSKLPQTFDGDAFAESIDGKIFRSTVVGNGSGQLNPGERSIRSPEFKLPVGTTYNQCI